MPLHCGRIGRPEAKAMPRKRKLETSNSGSSSSRARPSWGLDLDLQNLNRVATEDETRCIQGWARDVDAMLARFIARCEEEGDAAAA